MSTQTETRDTMQAFLDDFEALAPKLASREPSWLQEIRKEALSRFTQLGFPSSKQEEWRFTNIRPILERPYLRPGGSSTFPQADLERFEVDGLDSYRLVFINGFLSPEHSALAGLPQGVIVTELAEAAEKHGELLEPHFAKLGSYENKPFAALNTALMTGGALVYVPMGAQLKKPVQLLYLTNAEEGLIATYPRTLIVASANSELTVIESYAGLADQRYLTNAVTEIVAGENAQAHVCRFHRESEQAFHLSNTQCLLSRDAQLTHHNVIFGGRITRNDIDAVLNGENINCTLNGLYMGRDDQLIDNHTNLIHEKPHCNSWEMYKGILNDKSQGIFKGKIFVQKDAQKTDAKQTSQGLLLSENAGIHAMPQLEIYADDVKCTHGATTGRLDEKAIFYARSRGIPEKAARALLTYAFASELIDLVPNDAVQEELRSLLKERLPFEA